MSDSGHDRSGDISAYALGYGTSLLLTATAFAVVHWPFSGFNRTFSLIAALGLIQMLVQFRFFLHVSLRRTARTDLMVIAFSAIIILLMVSGSLIILFNLRLRMM